MAISVVQSAEGISAGATLNSPTTAGNSIIVFAAGYSQNSLFTHPLITGVSLGSTSDTFNLVLGYADNTNFGNLRIFWDQSCTGGQTGITVATNSNLPAANCYVYVLETSPLGALDVKSTHANASLSSTSWTSNATATTSIANELAVGFAIVYNPAGTTSITTSPNSAPWASFFPVVFGANKIQQVVAAYNILSSTQTITYNGTNAAGASMAAVATFSPPKVAGAGSPRGAGSLSAGGYIAGFSAPKGAGKLPTAQSIYQFNTENIPGAGLIAATVQQQEGPLTLAGTGTLTTPAIGPQGNASASGAGTLTASGSINGAGNPMAGAGVLAANASVNGITQGIAALAAAGALPAPGSIEMSIDITGSTSMAGGNSTLLPGKQPLAGSGTLTARPEFLGATNIMARGSVKANGVSTTIVNISRKFRWNNPILGGTITAGVNFNTLENITDSPVLGWNVAETDVIPTLVRFNVLDRVSGTAQSNWNIGILVVNVTAQASWRALLGQEISPELAWNLAQTSHLSAKINWFLRAQVNKTATLEYRDRERVRAVPGQFAWRTKHSVNVFRGIRWNTLAKLNILRDIYWHLRVQDTLSRLVTWNLGVTPVNVTATCTWEDLAKVPVTAHCGWKTTGRPTIGYDIYWNTLAGQALSATIEWNIQAMPQMAIRQTALNPIFFSYPGT